MSIYCKNCGTELENVDGQKIAVCDFCGMEQTLPTLDNPEKLELFAKANELRMASKFDIAKKQYESIIAQYPDDNEAYWCKLLCVYGIEYVDDDLTEKKIPTCHRTVTESIFDNSDYKLIMSRATEEESAIYEAEAKEIDRIQKEILAKADKEEPYDIFICYKESSNDSKKRTIDAQYATKIYTHLTEHGYKVFFSRITLKNKLGTEYEPIIYSALKSAKVMLHVTTNLEHTNAPWVRNEWSRFLEFMNGDVTKIILPCIAQMGPYELPEELSKFQVADMTDLDFLENLARQIDSKFGKERRVIVEQVTKPETTRTEPVSNGKNDKIDNFINRAKLSLNHNDWMKASEFAEKCLDIDYKCAEAYVIKLLCDFQESELENLTFDLDFMDNANYQQALQFADNKLRTTLENLEKQYYYQRSYTFGDNLLDDRVYNSIKECLEQASGYKDADKLLAELEADRILAKKKHNYELALPLLKNDLTAEKKYNKVKDYLVEAVGYKDAKELLESLPKLRAEQEKVKYYKHALPLLETDLTVEENYKKAEDILIKADDYKDAKELLESLPKLRAEQEKIKCYQLALTLLKRDLTVEENYKKAEDILAKADDYKHAKELLESLPKLRSKQEKVKYYKLAMSLLKRDLTIEENYKKAKDTLLKVDDYRDAKEYLDSLPQIRINQSQIKMKLSADKSYYIVKGIKDKKIKICVIPSTYKGLPVIRIETKAFKNCKNLTNMVIPNSVTSIGKGAFFNCNNLKTLIIPFVGEAKCGTFNTTLSYMFSIKAKFNIESVPMSLKTVIITDTKSIEGCAFKYCSSLTSIEIPDSVTSIGEYAFSGCSGLTSIEIPDSVISIGYEAFEGCSKLTIYCEVESKPSGWSSCWSSNCPVVWGYVGEKGVTENGYVWGLTSNNTITIAGYMGNSTELIIPEKINGYSVTSIGSYAFNGCKSLTSIEIPISVTSIGDYAFEDCDSLTSIEITNSVTTIENCAFCNCSSLASVKIPDSVTSIGGSAFNGCKSLTSIEIPNSVTSIGGYAFYNCDSLTSVEIPDSVISIGDYAFSGCPIETATIPTTAISCIPKGKLKTVVINGGTSIGNSAFV